MVGSNKLTFTRYCVLSTMAIVLAIAPANALPGQNINTVLKWVKTKPQLPPALEYGQETQTYYGTKKNLTMHISVSQDIVRSESISINGDSQTKFTQKNAKAVKLLQDIYGSNIANDFKNARYVTKVANTHFFRGQKFAYTASDDEGTANNSGYSGLEIIPLNKLQENIDNTKFCQTHLCDV
jgi:hypothetical protein